MYMKSTMIPAMVLGLAIVGCTRTDQAETRPEQQATVLTPEQRAERDQYVTQMEQRIAGLEQKLANMKQQPAKTGVKPERIEDLQESVKELRQEIADLRTAGAESWWSMTERSLERTRADVQSDIERQTTPTGTRARTDVEKSAQQQKELQEQQQQQQQQQAATQDVNQQRQQFISRMESEIQQLEQQLNQVAQKTASAEEIEDAREQLNDLKQELTAVRNMNQETWWETTRNRLDRSASRLEKSIENMTTPNQGQAKQ